VIHLILGVAGGIILASWILGIMRRGSQQREYELELRARGIHPDQMKKQDRRTRLEKAGDEELERQRRMIKAWEQQENAK
jgi:hypothetical protein